MALVSELRKRTDTPTLPSSSLQEAITGGHPSATRESVPSMARGFDEHKIRRKPTAQATDGADALSVDAAKAGKDALR